jgi:hypothetical protein
MWFLPPLIHLPSPSPLLIPARDFHGIAFFAILTALALLWIFAYAFAIHRARIDKRVGIPCLAVVGNFSWEFVHSTLLQQDPSQRPYDLAWLAVDCVIIVQVFKYGRKDFPGLSERAFRWMLVGALAWSGAFYILITRDIHDTLGLYDSTMLVVFESWCFIYTLRRRKSSAGQSLYVAVFKWWGTFLAGVETLFVYPHRTFLLFMFGTAFVLDVTYTVLLYRRISAEGQSPWALSRPPVTGDTAAPATSGVTARVGS